MSEVKRKYVYCVQKERDKDKWRVFTSAVSEGYSSGHYNKVAGFEGLSSLPDACKQIVLLYLASDCKEEGVFNGVGYERLLSAPHEDAQYELWLRLYFDEKQDY